MPQDPSVAHAANAVGQVRPARRKKARLPRHLRQHGAKYVKSVEIILLAVGLYAIHQNTKSNLTASRSQLYASEEVVNVREFDAAGTALQSLYAHPDTSIRDPRSYCRIRLRILASDSAIVNADNVEALYEAFEGIASFGGEQTTDGVVETRKAFIHLSTIFGLMHSAQDYKNGGVLGGSELGTWLGYADDIGPHPLLLVTIWNWHEAGYMSRTFAKAIRDKLLDADPRNRAIIAHFYPAMLTDGFLTSLRDY
jgi:hypothetical protein